MWAAWHAVYLRPWSYKKDVSGFFIHKPNISWSAFVNWTYHAKELGPRSLDGTRLLITNQLVMLTRTSTEKNSLLKAHQFSHADDISEKKSEKSANKLIDGWRQKIDRVVQNPLMINQFEDKLKNRLDSVHGHNSTVDYKL